MPSVSFIQRFLLSSLLVGPAACATTVATTPALVPSPPSPVMAEAIATARTPVAESQEEVGPVERGELPWWYRVRPSIYSFDGRTVVVGIGRATTHHHIAEGFLKSKVTARLSVRKASEPIRFQSGIPEPRMVDLFINREGHFLALYMLDVPESATTPDPIASLAVPASIRADDGRRRIGRHVYDGQEHLFLECEIEGPIANPDWGRSRASAFLFRAGAPRGK